MEMKQFLFSVISIFFLFVFPPLGIFLMFRLTNWPVGMKKSVAVIWSVIWLIAIWQAMQETMLLMQTGV